MESMEGPIEQAPDLKEMYPIARKGVFQQWGVVYRNIIAYRFFIYQLIKVNLLVDFKRSFLGLSWLFIVPILSVIIWILLNGAGVVNPGNTEIPYPAYVLLSTSIWGFFAEIYKSISNLINTNGRMMIMTYFPHEVLIIEKFVVHFIRFSIPFAINIVVLLYFGIQFTWLALLIPLTLIPLLFMGAAIGLIVALLRIVAVDISNLIDEGIRLLMFLTPVVYAPKISIGWLSEIITINPMTYLIGFNRDLLTKGTFYELQNYLICSAIALAFFLIAIRIFRVTESRILERLINT